MNTIRQLCCILVNFCQGLFALSFLTFPFIYPEVPVIARKTIFHKSNANIADEIFWFFHLSVKELVIPQDGDAMSENSRTVAADKGQLSKLSGVIGQGLSKPRWRLVKEMIYGTGCQRHQILHDHRITPWTHSAHQDRRSAFSKPCRWRIDLWDQ